MGKNQSKRGGRFGRRKRQRKVERDGKSGGEKSSKTRWKKCLLKDRQEKERKILRDIF